jgi:hypothetical protein
MTNCFLSAQNISFFPREIILTTEAAVEIKVWFCVVGNFVVEE